MLAREFWHGGLTLFNGHRATRPPLVSTTITHANGPGLGTETWPHAPMRPTPLPKGALVSLIVQQIALFCGMCMCAEF
jgi:hypothetical protein